MREELLRTAMLIGETSVKKLEQASVIVFGIGGVGSYTVEALARAGVGKIGLVDNDTVSLSNINRQLIALHSTVGMPKTEIAKNRIMDINPNCRVDVFACFYSEENEGGINLEDYDYIVDAIDSVASKILLVERATTLNIPIIASMGTGNKLDPSRFKIADINKTEMCPLAKVMRWELRKRGIKKLKVLFSDEQPIAPNLSEGETRVPASISFVPSTAGLIIAGEVIRSIISE